MRQLADRRRSVQRFVARVRRSPVAARAARRRLGAIVVAVLVGVAVHRTVSDAERVRAAWGRTIVVVVAARDLDAGDPLVGPAVRVVERPRTVVPDGALTEVPEGRRVATAVPRGEVLVSSRLTTDRAASSAALLPDGSAAVTLPEGTTPFDLVPGDLVDVLAARWDPTDPTATSSDRAGGVRVVAASALVVSTSEGRTTIAVDRSQVRDTAAAILAGDLTVALVG